MTAPTPTRRTPPVAGIASLAVGTMMLVGPFLATASAAPGFNATASAFGVRAQVTLSQAPLTPDLVDGGGPSAQASYDSLGNGRAVAALPYPGELALGLPGLVSGLGPQVPGLINAGPSLVTGLIPGIPPAISELLAQAQLPPGVIEPIVAAAPPLPPYPFAAQAALGTTPEAHQDLGFATLDATAVEGDVAAATVLRSGVDGVTAADVDANATVSFTDDGGVISSSRSVVRGLQVGPVVIGTVRTTARMEIDENGDVVDQFSELRVSGVEVGGISVDLTPNGFELAGAELPIPIAQTVNTLIGGAGLEFTVLSEEITDGAVISGGLQISRALDLGAQGTGAFKLIIGQSTATLAGAPAPDFSFVPAVPDAVADTASGSGARPSVGSPQPATGSASATPVSPATPSEPAAPQLAGARIPGLDAEPFDALDIYLVIVGAALAAFGSGQVMRAAAFRPRTATTTSPGGN